jgi:hypothetical protein
LKSYQDLLGSRKGNAWQRFLRWWFFPTHPELAILIYTLLGVTIFRTLAMQTFGSLQSGEQGNYFVGESTLDNLLEFATRDSVHSEILHTTGVVLGILTLVWTVLGGPVNLVFIAIFTLGNLYCVFLQRYNRARLMLLVVKRLGHGRRPSLRYGNWLGLDFGQ